MVQTIRTACRLLILLTILTGVAYPLLVTGVAQLAFPETANGSLLRRGERVLGSRLLGQPFSDPKYFWGRLSATGPSSYNAALSSGSNYGPLHPALREAARGRIDALTPDGVAPVAIPVDLVTASGSGLDPHISPAAAAVQVSRVAATRKVPEAVVRDLVLRFTEGRQWGMLGEPRVNVLLLNLALDEQQ